jgi:gamma-glutamyltranspeptidase/glutathione hydrolase
LGVDVNLLRLILALSAICLLAAAPPPVRSDKGMVAADHRLGSAAGAEVLAAGGNAVDAVVAAALAVGVVQPAGSGLGGGGFAVVVQPNGEASVLDFREEAPGAATREMYVMAGADDASRIGGLAVGVPGEAAGLVELHRRWGALPLATVAAPAIRLAKDGFEVGHHLAEALAGLGEEGPALAMGLFGSSEVPVEGDHVERAKLGKTLELLVATRGGVLTSGKAAADIVRSARKAGGVLTEADLAEYRPKDREPVVGSYRGWKVITMPPPSSGGAVLLQILGVLESSDVAGLGAHSAAYFHRLTEAMKHAFADRARLMGDPDRVEVPVGQIVSAERIAAVAADFDATRTFESEHYGIPVDPGTDGGTQHISVLDAQGMAVALTTTINTSFGSRVFGSKSGVLLNNEMDDFVSRPGEPNHYGLVGSEANAVAPGARPLSSMSPTVLISPDESERIVVGASGGPFIISSTLQVIVDIIDFQMDVAEAVSLPRIHHQWSPNTLFVDTHTSPDTIAVLRGLGHRVTVMDFFSSVQVVRSGPEGIEGASDPRKGGWPVGVK